MHGCLRTSSVFASDGGEWKVGGFEVLSSMKDEDAVIYVRLHSPRKSTPANRSKKYNSLVPDIGRFLPPEVSSGNWDAIKRNPLPAIDAYGFGLLVYESFNGGSVISEHAIQAKGIPRTLQQPFKRLLNANPKARLSVAHFLEQGRRNGGFFQTALINLSEGIDGLGLMSDGEKEDFFRYYPLLLQHRCTALTALQPARAGLRRLSGRFFEAKDITRIAEVR